jgi:hypothetical protein
MRFAKLPLEALQNFLAVYRANCILEITLTAISAQIHVH